MESKYRYQQAKKVTLIGAAINTLLGISKTIGGVVFHSHGLIADGVHSFADLITDAMVLVASKYGSQDADVTHPYGHQRIETAATVFLAILLIAAGSGIAWDSIDEIIHKKQTIAGALALPIAVFSILANELLFHYTRRIGKRIQSELIIANAWHHRSDAASSLVVVAGLIGNIEGFAILDPLAAIIVGCMIIKMGLNYGWNSLKELVDTAADADMLVEIEQIICQIHGVRKIHQLRSRLMGGDILVDVHILVDPGISVSEGHYIAQHVHNKLVDSVSKITDVTVHVDPEDDEICSPSLHLPSRVTLEKNVLHQLKSEFPGIESWVLHYLDGKLSIDIIFDPSFNQWDALNNHIQTDLSKHPLISSIRLLTHMQTLDINNT